MDTQTGRIYSPDEMWPVVNRAARREAEQNLSRAQRELAQLVDDGVVVPVSEEVVQKVKLGERELRRRRNRQARAARKRNRN